MTRMKQKPQPKPRQINWWKWVTLALCGLLLGSGIWFVAKVVTPYDEPATNTVAKVDDSQPAFSVQLTKSQVNHIVDYYLNDYLKDSKIKYSLTVGDSALLGGSFKFFGATIKFGLHFEPLVKANGDVELKATKLNVGSLPVPISYVLNYVGHAYKLPKWVALHSSKETIVLKLSELKLQNGMRVQPTKIDLPNDDIDFAVYLPKK